MVQNFKILKNVMLACSLCTSSSECLRVTCVTVMNTRLDFVAVWSAIMVKMTLHRLFSRISTQFGCISQWHLEMFCEPIVRLNSERRFANFITFLSPIVPVVVCTTMKNEYNDYKCSEEERSKTIFRSGSYDSTKEILSHKGICYKRTA